MNDQIVITFPFDEKNSLIKCVFLEERNQVIVVANQDGMRRLATWLMDYLVKADPASADFTVNAGNGVVTKSSTDLAFCCDVSLD